MTRRTFIGTLAAVAVALGLRRKGEAKPTPIPKPVGACCLPQPIITPDGYRHIQYEVEFGNPLVCKVSNDKRNWQEFTPTGVVSWPGTWKPLPLAPPPQPV